MHRQCAHTRPRIGNVIGGVLVGERRQAGDHLVHVSIQTIYFLHTNIFALKNLFSVLPFYLFALSHIGLNWCMAVGG